MSAIAAAWGADGAIMVADGVAYDETGSVIRYTTKIARYPHLNCLIGATGVGGFLHVLGWMIDGGKNRWEEPFGPISTFDDLVTRFAELCEEAHFKMHWNGRWYNDGPDTRTNAVLLGWSESQQRYEGYRVTSYEKGSTSIAEEKGDGADCTTLEPFKLHPLPEAIWCSTNPSADHRRAFGITSDHSESSYSMMIRLICANRAESGPIKNREEGDPSHFNVGGFIEVALLRPGHVESWIAHRWSEDVIGEPIDPERGDPLPGHLLDQPNETSE